MTEIKKYEGSWIDYQKDLEKFILDTVIHDNWDHFLECFDLGVLPENAVKFLNKKK